MPEQVRARRSSAWPGCARPISGSSGGDMDFCGVLRRGFELALSLTAPPATVDFAPLVIDEITVIGSKCGLSRLRWRGAKSGHFP